MRHKRLLLALFAVACAHQPQQSTATAPSPAPEAANATRRYTVVMAGNTAGSQVVTTRGNQTIVDYEYNDRGRGPKTHTVLLTDARGVTASEETSGNDYFKVPVTERFTTVNGEAKWSSTSESGSAKSGAFFVSYYGPPEEMAVLARAALRAGGTLPMLPGGTLTVQKAGETTIRGTHLTAYTLSGLAFSPFEIWLDDDRNFFASGSSWQSVIREGFEADAPALIAEQDARSKARVAQLASKYTHHPEGGRLVVTNTRVFDPRSGSLSAPTTIVVEGNRIVSVGADAPVGGTVVDAAGKVTLPGLWDMHVHMGEDDGILDIAAGVTSARDLGNDVDFITDLKKKIDEGAAIGPRLVMAGLVDGPGPFHGPTKLLLSTEDEARKTIDMLVTRGFEGLKIYSSIDPALVPTLTSYAHAHGLRVSGHVPAGMTAAQAIDAGYDEIQHANMLFLNFMPDVKDTRTPARFIEVAKRGADLDFNSPEFRAFEQKMLDHHTVSDPTVAVFETLFTARPGQLSPTYAMVADRFPPQIRRALIGGGLPVPEGMDARYRASFAKMLALVAELHRAGVTIVAGTDGMAGFTLHRELELYAQAGLANAEVLRIATLEPAQILKRDKDLGTIEPGKLADFILVDGDPTKNISDIRKVVTVVKDGNVYDPKELYGEMGVH